MTHVADILLDWLAGGLDESEAVRVEDHLAECAQCRAALDKELRLVAAATPASAPPRGRLLQDATTLARFDQFATQVASLMDVDIDRAREWLANIDDPDVWEDTALGPLDLYHLEGGPAVANCITGFTRLAPGTSFPEHTHLGREYNLVIQGKLRDEHGVVHGPGSLVERDEGTTHEIAAEPGVPLIYLSIVGEGVEIFGMRFGADSDLL